MVVRSAWHFGAGMRSAPSQEMSQCLLSMQVFDEVRNLALGLAARGVPWRSMTRSSTIAIGIVMVRKLFSNLFARSKFIAESLVARGIGLPHQTRQYQLNIPVLLPSNSFANATALALLVACVSLVWQRRVGL
jgi:energy-coupling factor transporter transmembrane protein EcfT